MLTMNSLRNKLSNRKLIQNGLVQLQSYSSTSTSSPEIQIPNRKERGSTDILRALESTIRRDPTAPHYKYIDDPYLIPLSILDKRIFALSRESGRKAAMWIRQEHAEFFDHKIAEPFIESFAPRSVYTEKSQVSEEILLNNIKNANVDNSTEIYNLLEGNVKMETKLALFELLCFYNSTNPINTELVEERWFSVNEYRGDISNWVECQNKQQLFKSLTAEEGDMATAAYNALITGLVKYNNLVKAWDLYEQCKEKNIPMNKRTYDHLISAIIVAKYQDNDRLILLQQIYKEMVENNLRPDIKTMNASMNLVTKMSNFKKITFLKILNEFKSIDVKPSLGTYFYFLKCFDKSNFLAAKAVSEILDILENEMPEFQGPEDKLFFVLAMRCAHNAQSMRLGQRLHKLIMKSNNYSFIKDAYQENVYYRYYLLLHLKTVSFKSFMEFYQELTPNIYNPENIVFLDILKAVKELDSQAAMEILPIFCSQVIMFDYIRSDDIMDAILDLMTGHCKPPSDSPLIKTFAQNASSYWEGMKELKAKSKRGHTHVASILGKIAILYLRNEEFDQMLEVLSILVFDKSQVIGSMTPEFIKEIFEGCLTRGHAEAALGLIEYAIEYGMDEGITMGMKAYKTLGLSAAQETRLKSLVGKDFK